MFLRYGEDFAIGVVKSDGYIASDLNVLFLVGADGDEVAVEDEDVGCLQDRICEQPVIWTHTLGDFVFEACASLQKSHRGNAGKQPSELGNFWHIGLTPEDGFFGIKTEGDIIHCYIESVLSNIIWGRIAGKGVVVGNKIKAIVLGLEFEVLAHCAEEITYVKPTRWLYARQNSQG
jgi:hypothetical protein